MSVKLWAATKNLPRQLSRGYAFLMEDCGAMGNRLQAVGRNKKARRYQRMILYAANIRLQANYIGLVVLGKWREGAQVRHGVDTPAWIDIDPCPGHCIGFLGPKDGHNRWTIVSSTPWKTTPHGHKARHILSRGEPFLELTSENAAV